MATHAGTPAQLPDVGVVVGVAVVLCDVDEGVEVVEIVDERELVGTVTG